VAPVRSTEEPLRCAERRRDRCEGGGAKSVSRAGPPRPPLYFQNRRGHACPLATQTLSMTRIVEHHQFRSKRSRSRVCVRAESGHVDSAGRCGSATSSTSLPLARRAPLFFEAGGPNSERRVTFSRPPRTVSHIFSRYFFLFFSARVWLTSPQVLPSTHNAGTSCWCAAAGWSRRIADLADHGLGRPIGSGSGPRGRREVRPWPYLPTALNPLRAVLIGPGAGEKTGEAGFPNRSMPVAQ
jgi:hypothetical protein